MKKHKCKKPEFSKIIVAVVMITYFVGIYIGAKVVLEGSPEQLSSYLAFIGTPTATTIGFYCWKAKNENMNKNKNRDENIPELIEPITQYDNEEVGMDEK